MIVGAFLDPIEKPLTWLLEWLHSTIGLPWAWAIVATTVIVRMLLVPLTVKQIHSMQRLQRHAPEMKEIQKRYKDDKVRQREELMKFYKENRINPASSCLPIVFQIPVFIGLFFVLRDFETEVLPDYPRSDLGWLGVVPNVTADANTHWSGYLLLAIYAVSQTVSTFLMSTTMDKTQRTIMLVLPLTFLFFVLNFPAGLVVYWVTTNLWTTGQGLVTRRLAPRIKPAPPQKRSSRTPKAEERAAADGAKPTEAAQKTASAAPRRVKRKKKKARR